MSPRSEGVTHRPDLAVWIVEDNSLYRRGLQAAIEAAPGMCCPLAAASCEELWVALDRGMSPEIVLMDIGLPVMDGIEGTRRLRNLAPAARVVMLTVHEEDEKVFAAVCAGASGYLLKPSPVEKILESIREVACGAAPINGYIAAKILTLFGRLPVPAASREQYGLSSREREALTLLADGLSMREISVRLGISYHTVDSHLRSIYDKLHVHSRSAAVAKALRVGLL